MSYLPNNIYIVNNTIQYAKRDKSVTICPEICYLMLLKFIIHELPFSISLFEQFIFQLFQTFQVIYIHIFHDFVIQSVSSNHFFFFSHFNFEPSPLILRICIVGWFLNVLVHLKYTSIRNRLLLNHTTIISDFKHNYQYLHIIFLHENS